MPQTSIRLIDIHEPSTLDDYAAYHHLSAPVEWLRQEAAALVPHLRGRKVWMVNSTAQGGGVAEMMPKMVTLLRELGVETEWAVIGTDEERFFSVTKHLHNLIHGSGDPHIGRDDRQVYDQVSRSLARQMRGYLAPGDLLVVHDPQPAGMGALLKQETGVEAIWRCHIGLDESNDSTRAAWDFLQPWTSPYDRCVFTLADYVPDYLSGRSRIIPPGIDPLSHKNRELPTHKLGGVLTNASLAPATHPMLTPAFATPAERLQREAEAVAAAYA